NGSVLLYRHGLMLGDDGLLSLVQAQTAIEAAVDECDRFYPAFQFLLWGDKSPAEALASALIDAAGEA
ncbi:YbjN domain-containing protein, partial [Escherichia coli]|nr:YbjN domain-containing protein [Escherichia coli]